MVISISNAPLKGIFFTHFILTVWTVQAEWPPSSYLYYNLVLLAVILWSLHNRDSEEPVQMALVVNTVCIVLDLITAAIFTGNINTSLQKFGLATFILNLIARPVACVFLYRIQTERVGGYNNYGVPGISDYFGRRGPYENIDQPTPQSVPQTTVDTGSPYHHSGPPAEGGNYGSTKQ